MWQARYISTDFLDGYICEFKYLEKFMVEWGEDVEWSIGLDELPERFDG